jgi:hypothetical protein
MIFNRSAGFRSFFPPRSLALPDRMVPGSMRARDRFTACSPSSEVGDYFRFLLHRGVSQRADPDHDRVCVVVPVTVSRASSAASGRCHPALTGIGVVPWRHSPALITMLRQCMSPPRRSGRTWSTTARPPAPRNGLSVAAAVGVTAADAADATGEPAAHRVAAGGPPYGGPPKPTRGS